MLTRDSLRRQFGAEAAAADGCEPPPLFRGSNLSPFGHALVLVGRLAYSPAGWATLHLGGDTLRIRWEAAGSLAVELVEGRVEGYGLGAPVLATLRLDGGTPVERVTARIERFIRQQLSSV